MDSLPSLLAKLTTSVQSAINVVPDAEKVNPPQNGISLLDTKNELLVSYLQNLVFLILVKLRNQKEALRERKTTKCNGALSNGHDRAEDNGNDRPDMGEQAETKVDEQDVVKKLVELRVYLERGVKPLESRLKYQVDKVIRAAETADRAAAATATNNAKIRVNGHSSKTKRGQSKSNDNDIDGNVSVASGSDDASSSESEIDELSYRPNLAAFATEHKDGRAASSLTRKNESSDSASQAYRPPRINPTSMPTTTTSRADRDHERGAAAPRSRTIDDYISTELSQTPLVEPSIGSTIVAGGRRTTSARERREEDERREYEETNFVRLPAFSKKEKRERERKRRDIDGAGAGHWGGEDLTGLGAGLDRIDRVISGLKKSSSSSAGKRKLGDTGRLARMTADGPRGDGFIDAGPGLAAVSKRRRVGAGSGSGSSRRR